MDNTHNSNPSQNNLSNVLNPILLIYHKRLQDIPRQALIGMILLTATINNNASQYYQQFISNDASSNNDTISHNYQQSVSNNFSPSPPKSNISPLLNSLDIIINSPQTNIIILPSTNSDIQNQLQHYLNYPPSTNSSQTQFQQ
ncbi:hypothetical protein C1645_816427 [Glomus cerebriforme]|uniref:Uncharacterized protein n=1 Tax=Glomus cerebriforme TaxID=658196 RepID=A0A397TL95_9GLOM|nr:hypothetical protein C1645_816427 [Glomus cerebriforme]